MEAVSQQVITKIMTTFQDKAKENRRPRKKNTTQVVVIHTKFLANDNTMDWLWLI
jgi:hypothetical protein